MGIIDFIQNNTPFLSSREGDFIPLDKTGSNNENPVGPPVLILYAVPNSIEMEEFSDMVCDGMPSRRVVDGITADDNSNGNDVVMIRRLEGIMDENGEGGGDELLDLSVQDALKRLVEKGRGASTSTTATATTSSSSPTTEGNVGPCPVLYFSGVSNKEMMETYKIIADEIYAETNGVHWPACAKVVSPAMDKSMRQVLSEISGDHADAMKQGTEEEKQVG